MGDCLLPNLGLEVENMEMLQKKINVVFHSAATVRFDADLNVAFQTNVSATKCILELCCSMENIKVRYLRRFIYLVLSTVTTTTLYINQTSECRGR